jgi:hypothetical protein
MAEFHKAEFYRGSVFECLSNRLSIEGRPVRLVDDRRTKLAKAKLATGETFTAASLPELAKVIIDKDICVTIRNIVEARRKD